MTKTKLLGIGLIAVLILNAVLIVFLIRGPKHKSLRMGKGPKQGPKYLIIEALNFSDEQILQYESLIDEHRKTIREEDDKIRKFKGLLYSGLVGEASQSEAALDSISAAQKRIELAHLKHFKDIKGICTEEQLAAYSKLTKDLPKLFAPKGRRPPPHRH